MKNIIILLLLLPILTFSQDYSFSEYKKIGYDEDMNVYSYTFKELKQEAKKSTYHKMLLGDAFRRGINTDIDEKKAFKQYKDASENGYNEATHRLAFMYKNGFGTQENTNKFITLLKSCAEDGNINCIHDLGVIYYFGMLVEKDYQKSQKYFLNIYDEDKTNERVMNANFLLGNIYDLEEAIDYGVEISLSNSYYHYYISGKGQKAIENISNNFLTLEDLKYQDKKALSYLPELETNIDYLSFEAVNKLMNEINNLSNILPKKNIKDINSEIISNLFNHHLDNSNNCSSLKRLGNDMLQLKNYVDKDIDKIIYLKFLEITDLSNTEQLNCIYTYLKSNDQSRLSDLDMYIKNYLIYNYELEKDADYYINLQQRAVSEQALKNVREDIFIEAEDYFLSEADFTTVPKFISYLNEFDIRFSKIKSKIKYETLSQELYIDFLEKIFKNIEIAKTYENMVNNKDTYFLPSIIDFKTRYENELIPQIRTKEKENSLTQKGIEVNPKGLNEAVKRRDITAIKNLLELGVSPNEKYSEPLLVSYPIITNSLLASKNPQLANKIYDLLIKHKADPYVINEGLMKTSILVAALNDSTKQYIHAEYILKNGVEFEREVRNVFSKGISFGYYDTSKFSKLEFLFKKGVSPDYLLDKKSKATPLMSAVGLMFNKEEVIKYLISKGANVNAKDNQGFTPIFYAAHEEDGEKIIRLLVNNGADIFHTYSVKGVSLNLYDYVQLNDNCKISFNSLKEYDLKPLYNPKNYSNSNSNNNKSNNDCKSYVVLKFTNFEDYLFDEDLSFTLNTPRGVLIDGTDKGYDELWVYVSFYNSCVKGYYSFTCTYLGMHDKVKTLNGSFYIDGTKSEYNIFFSRASTFSDEAEVKIR